LVTNRNILYKQRVNLLLFLKDRIILES